MAFTTVIKESLEREYTISTRTISFYKRQIKIFEKKYEMTTASFLKKFEKGKMGDGQDFFDWYAFHRLLSNWTSTQKALLPLIK